MSGRIHPLTSNRGEPKETTIEVVPLSAQGMGMEKMLHSLPKAAAAKRPQRGRELSFVLGNSLLLRRWLLKAGVSTSSKLSLELFNPASGVQELQLAGEERMASRANVNAQVLAGATRHERIATAAGNRSLVILRMNAGLHGRTYSKNNEPLKGMLNSS